MSLKSGFGKLYRLQKLRSYMLQKTPLIHQWSDLGRVFSAFACLLHVALVKTARLKLSYRHSPPCSTASYGPVHVWSTYLGRKSHPCCTHEAIANHRQWWKEANGVSPPAVDASESNSSVSKGLNLKSIPRVIIRSIVNKGHFIRDTSQNSEKN